MATISIECSKCTKPVDMQVEQQLLGYSIHWFKEYNCKNCGYSIHLDGFATELPQNLREAILTQQGLWELSINEESLQSAPILLTLRKTLNLSIQDLNQLRKLVPQPIFSGTFVEVERLKKILLAQKATVSTSKKEGFL